MFGLFKPKFHCYAFTFRDNEGYKSTYMLYPEKDQLTVARIEEASEYSGCVNSMCLISVVYLGHMTQIKLSKGRKSNVETI